MANIGGGEIVQSNVNNALVSEEPSCWICFEPASKEEPMTSPCRCRGSIKYVHHSCLATWCVQSGATGCGRCGHLYRYSCCPPPMPLLQFLVVVVAEVRYRIGLDVRWARMVLLNYMWCILLYSGTIYTVYTVSKNWQFLRATSAPFMLALLSCMRPLELLYVNLTVTMSLLAFILSIKYSYLNRSLVYGMVTVVWCWKICQMGDYLVPVIFTKTLIGGDPTLLKVLVNATYRFLLLVTQLMYMLNLATSPACLALIAQNATKVYLNYVVFRFEDFES